MKLPDNTPKTYIRKKHPIRNSKPVVVCVGDSLTHGRISSNYINILQSRFGTKFEFINAGINSNLAWNVLMRLDEVIECKPDFVTILIGTNDVNATLSVRNMKDYIKRMNLPKHADLNWFKESLGQIVVQLKENTEAQIALITLPTIGESLEGELYDQIKDYNQIIQDIGEKHDADCLTLDKVMKDYLSKNPANPRFSYENGMRLMVWSAIQHYLFLRSWDSISRRAGFELHLDYLHLNSKGASMIADLIEGFIRSHINMQIKRF